MRFSTLQAWLQWQETLHPSAIDMGLERIRKVYQGLPGPVSPRQVITVAGTNGKGSSVAMLDAIYRAAGYRVASYTSPHILRYNERIQVMGQPVDDARICTAFERVDQARGQTSLTYFEFGTLAALEIFDAQPLDVVILEVGLGGRLDATNIVDADLALITNVGLDHTQWLGNSIEQIAREKAGVIKPGRPVVYGERQVPSAVLEVAAGNDSECLVCGRDFDFQVSRGGWRWQAGDACLEDLTAPGLPGEFQYGNAAAVVTAVQRLQKTLPVSRESINQGLAGVRLPGRFTVLPGEVTVILDVAHNPMGMQNLLANLRAMQPGGRLHAVVGFMQDKDIAGMVNALGPAVEHWYAAALPLPRGADCVDLDRAVGPTSATWQCFPSPLAAWQAARSAAGSGDRILVTGSFVTVAEIMAEIG